MDPESRTPCMATKKHSNKDMTPKEKAARANSGQEQEPKQSKEDSSRVWDTPEHSDAPGPFGTGGE